MGFANPAEKPLSGQKNEWKDGKVRMSELWTVEFSLTMRDVVGDNTPSIDGEIVVRGYDIFDVLDKARDRLSKFGYDGVVIHGANRSGFEKKGEKENE